MATVPDYLPDSSEEHYEPLNRGFTKREYAYESLATPVMPVYFPSYNSFFPSYGPGTVCS